MKKLITKLIVVFAIVTCVLNIVTIKTFANIDKKGHVFNCKTLKYRQQSRRKIQCRN